MNDIEKVLQHCQKKIDAMTHEVELKKADYELFCRQQEEDIAHYNSRLEFAAENAPFSNSVDVFTYQSRLNNIMHAIQFKLDNLKDAEVLLFLMKDQLRDLRFNHGFDVGPKPKESMVVREAKKELKRSMSKRVSRGKPYFKLDFPFSLDQDDEIAGGD